MKVLIAGVNGFFGNKLAETLLLKNYKVIGIGLNPIPSISDIEYHRIDLTENVNIDDLTEKCDVIFHFSSLTAHNDIVNNPVLAESININGARIIIESIARHKKKKKFIFASSGKVYGNHNKLPIKENFKTEPTNVLGKIKKNTERFIETRINGKDEFVILRIFNVYGPKQKENFVIPTILNQINLQKDKKNHYTISLGSTNHKRDYIYIDDLVQLFEKIATSKSLLNNINYFNVGSGIPISVNDIINIISHILSTDISISIEQKRLRNDESEVEYCSNEKISTLLSWFPKTDLITGLKNCIDDFGIYRNYTYK